MSYYSIEMPAQSLQGSPQVAMQMSGFGAITAPVNPLSIENDNRVQSTSSPSYNQVMEMIDRSISNLKVYVVESEITQTQDTIKAVVQQASF